MISLMLEKDLLPDVLIRTGIRRLLKQRLQDENKGDPEKQQAHLMSLISELKQSPIAISTEAANQQHYEVAADFFKLCLGPHLKYSSGYWNTGVKDLGKAEEDMLNITCQRAQLNNGQKVLELGCGWGSLSLYMAQKFPGSSFTAVSNSSSQKKYIDEQVRLRGLKNLRVATVNMNDLQAVEKYDRVVSVEMFEHMRNYKLLMKLVSELLTPDGKLFVHIFTHKKYAYKFEDKGESDWMSRYFFTGGMMPSDNLLLYFNEDLYIENHWLVNGLHYGKTAESWLDNMDKNKKEIMNIFKKIYAGHADKWWVYWRVFYMSCAELWKYNNGAEWMVSHYLFNNKNKSTI